MGCYQTRGVFVDTVREILFLCATVEKPLDQCIDVRVYSSGMQKVRPSQLDLELVGTFTQSTSQVDKYWPLWIWFEPKIQKQGNCTLTQTPHTTSYGLLSYMVVQSITLCFFLEKYLDVCDSKSREKLFSGDKNETSFVFLSGVFSPQFMRRIHMMAVSVLVVESMSTASVQKVLQAWMTNLVTSITQACS